MQITSYRPRYRALTLALVALTLLPLPLCTLVLVSRLSFSYLPGALLGLLVTALIAVLSLAASLPISLGYAFFMADVAKPPLRRNIAAVMRYCMGIPAVVVAFAIVLTAVRLGIKPSPLLAVLASVIFPLPHLCHLFERALHTVPPQHHTAAMALGMSPLRARLLVVRQLVGGRLRALLMQAIAMVVGQVAVMQLALGLAVSLTPFQGPLPLASLLVVCARQGDWGAVALTAIFLLVLNVALLAMAYVYREREA